MLSSFSWMQSNTLRRKKVYHCNNLCAFPARNDFLTIVMRLFGFCIVNWHAPHWDCDLVKHKLFAQRRSVASCVEMCVAPAAAFLAVDLNRSPCAVWHALRLQ